MTKFLSHKYSSKTNQFFKNISVWWFLYDSKQNYTSLLVFLDTNISFNESYFPLLQNLMARREREWWLEAIRINFLNYLRVHKHNIEN